MIPQDPSGRLYLLPAPLRPYDEAKWSRETVAAELPGEALRLFAKLDIFIVESERSALRLLSRFRDEEGMKRLKLLHLDEHSDESSLPALLDALLQGEDCGLLSEAGLPCIADPGAALVAAARLAGIEALPVSGPSSITLALAASGISGQSFCFLGYLPPSGQGRKERLRALAAAFERDGLTRIFIETPYRNDALLADCVALLPDRAWLAVAADLGGIDAKLRSMPVSAWKAAPLPSIGKVPAVFLFGRQAPLRPDDAGLAKGKGEPNRGVPQGTRTLKKPARRASP